MWLSGKIRIGLIGEAAALGYDYEHLGENIGTVSRLNDKASDFATAFRDAQRPAVILGQGALTRTDGAAVLRTAAVAAAAHGVVRDGWNGWNVLHTAAARVGGLDLGFVPRGGGRSAHELAAKGGADVLFIIGADEIELSASDAFVIYLGTHGDRGAHRADIILPGAAYTEKAGLYVNTEGRVQRGERAVWPKGEAKEDWAILRALSEHLGARLYEPPRSPEHAGGRHLGARLPYDTLDELRERLFAEHPTFGQIGYAPGLTPAALDLTKLGDAGPWSDTPLRTPIAQFHLTNPIARASKTMAECAALAAGVKLAAE